MDKKASLKHMTQLEMELRSPDSQAFALATRPSFLLSGSSPVRCYACLSKSYKHSALAIDLNDVSTALDVGFHWWIFWKGK